jgi:alkylation response protein AidB-like acyl-CoA dehydrogenase
MDNFFTDNADIQLLFHHTDLDEVIGLKEGDFSETEEYDFAFNNAQDAKEGYRDILTLMGEIAAQVIAPLAPDVDEEGCHFEHGTVTYPAGIQKDLDVLKRSNLMGFTLPRKYGGLNLPTFVYTIAIEMVSQGDASLMNLFGLQDIGDTICEFGNDEQKARYLPQFSSGEATGAMALTEPDAGSDLQAVQLKALYDEADGSWRLNGVKRFITNGCGDILLVLARSEQGTKDGRGLSMFIVEKDESVVVRRIENKLGIHGSPTCELQFNNARAYLVGKRRMGLIRYVMSLMNGARLGIASQGLGIAQAAYLEGLDYARAREQFGTAIINIPLVYEMLVSARVSIEAARVLTYDTARIVDLKKGYETKLEHTENPPKELRQTVKYYTRLAAVLTPMAKYLATEISNKVAYDMLQIHGGTGYMKDFNIERHYRDARITNIYEGTTQLQYVAAIGGVVTRVFEPELDKLEALYGEDFQKPYLKELRAKRELLSKAIEYVRAKEDHTYQSYFSDKLVDMATKLYTGYLFLKYAPYSEDKRKMMSIYFEKEMPQIEKNFSQVTSGKSRVIEEYVDLLKGSD